MALKFEYDKEKRTATVCGVDDKSCKEIIIPATVEYYKKEYKVTSIGWGAFSGCTSLTSVTIPDSVTKIGYAAFGGCSSLKEFKGKFVADNGRCLIKDNTFIAYAAASGTTYTLPDSVTTIASSAFDGCSSLTSVTIPNSVTSIESHAFDGCKSLKEVTIPNSVTTIGYAAFRGCSSLKEFKGKFVADNGRCLIKDNTFIAYAAASGTTYTLPNSVTSIGYKAFCNCDSLTSITIPDSVTSIGQDAFWNCNSLTSITIPDSVTTIANSAFWCCSSLTSVTIPNSVTTIEYYAFYRCKSLKEVTIPNSVTSIGKYAFYDCSSLTSITIPDSVTSIGEYAFYGCYSLTSVTIGNGVTSIGYDVFRGCTSLTSVTIGNGVTSIGIGAFNDCRSLTSINIPEGVTYIGTSAFRGCTSLTSVTIHDSVTSIGDLAFDGCRSIKEVYYTGDLSGWCKISFSNYDANPLYRGTKLFINGVEPTDITIPSDVTKVKADTFHYCTSLTSVTIPDSVTLIGERAFCGCYSLTSITIPDSVASIGSSTFSGCTSLTSVTIPDSVTSIGCFAFYECSSLTKVTIPKSVKTIDRYAFDKIPNIKVTICNDEGCVKIGSYAFDSTAEINYIGVNDKKSVSAEPMSEDKQIDLDKLIDAVIADGVITDKERAVILKKAVSAGYDMDEVEILLDGKLAEKLSKPKTAETTIQHTVKKETTSISKDDSPTAKNYDKYAVNGEGRYGKARMVEAVVKEYAAKRNVLVVEDLKKAFPDNVIRSFKEGVKDEKRWYKAELKNGEQYYISNQWGNNIVNFIDYIHANIEGIEITRAE